MENLSLVKNLLNKKGYKLTKQRQEILRIFLKNSQKHISAEELYLKLKDKDKDKDKGIGIATIYRNMNIFTDLGIIKEFKVDNRSVYELKLYAKKPLHIHFKCENCNRIEDIIDQEIILEYFKINKLIEEKQESKIFDIDIMFHGLCKDCIDKGR